MALLILFYLYLLVLPIPGTISVRVGLFVLLMGYSIYHLLTRREIFHAYISLIKQEKSLQIILTVLLIITLYIPFHSLFLAIPSINGMAEFSGQWLRPVFAFLVGGMIAVSSVSHRHRMLLILLATYATIVLIHLGDVTLMMAKNHWQIPYAVTHIVESKDRIGQITNGLMAGIFALFLHDLLNRDKSILTRWGKIILMLMMIAVIALSVQIQARNGWIGLVFITLSSLLLYLSSQKRVFYKTLIIAAMGLVVLGTLITIAYRSDSRWQSFTETANIALDWKNNTAWVDPAHYPQKDYPKLANGQMVDVSAYERISWIMGSLQMIAEHPLGYGFYRGVFGSALHFNYANLPPNPPNNHSHSGFLNWGLALGVPGLMLWLVFLGLLVYSAIQAWLKEKSAFGIFLFFIVCGFFSRSLVDSSMQDHMLEQFMMVVGFLSANTYITRKQSN